MNKTKKTYILAVSGGPDSIYLLEKQFRLKREDDRELVVAHVDYGLRKTSHDDAEFVQKMADLRGMTCEVLTVSKEELADRKGNLENWARDIRYRFFEDIRKKHSADAVLIAHTANDQAETVLMRLLQGTGLRGLAGIHAQRDEILRPLLSTTRLTILHELEKYDIPFRIDETNADTTFLRNQIRHDILPKLEQKDPTILKKLCDLAMLAQESLADIEQTRDAWLKKHIQRLHEDQILDLQSFLGLQSLLQHEILREVTGLSGRSGKEEKELARFLQKAKTKSSRTLSNGLRIQKLHDTVAFRSKEERRLTRSHFSAQTSDHGTTKRPAKKERERATASLSRRIPVDSISQADSTKATGVAAGASSHSN